MRRRPRGSGTIRKEGSGWAIVYGPRSARQYEAGFRTRAEAERRLVILRSEAMQKRLGTATDPRLELTLAELAAPWIERRRATQAAGGEDASRWRVHLAPVFGPMRPSQVDLAAIRSFVEAKRAELANGTVRILVSLLSQLYEDLRERGLAQSNPARGLPESLLRLMRSTYDPRTTPFIERLSDVRRIYLALPEPINVAYAIGALAGLRTGEVFALRWRSVDLSGRQILVSESIKGPTKDRDPRPVPIQDALLPVLKAWHIRTGGEGRVIPPMRSDGSHIDKGTPGPLLEAALRSLHLWRPGLEWYESTRHTFASHWAMAGRPLRALQAILGHSSIAITERYAHLSPGYWAPGVHSALAVDLSAPAGEVAPLDAPGHASVAHASTDSAKGASPTKRNNR